MAVSGAPWHRLRAAPQFRRSGAGYDPPRIPRLDPCLWGGRHVIWNEFGRARVQPSSEPDFLDGLVNRSFGEIVNEATAK